MSSSSEWPPQWKDVTESPQYMYYMIDQFLEPREEEKFEHLDNEYYYGPDCVGKTDGTIHQILLKFLRQVRESRGYDVDVMPPIHSPFIPVPLDRATWEDKSYFESFMNSTRFAVEEINAQAKEHGAGTRYELKDLEKIVDSRNRMVFLTFTVKEFNVDSDSDSDCDHVVKTVQAMVSELHGEDLELMEWRFKPDELLDQASPQVSNKSQASNASETPESDCSGNGD